MLAGEADLDARRLQKNLVAAEVVRQGVGGDAGDADFVKQVGGGTGPGGLVFEKRGNGVDDGCGWSFVQGVRDGFGLPGERGSGPICGVGMERRVVEGGSSEVRKTSAGSGTELGEDFGALRFEFGPDVGLGSAGGGGDRGEADGNDASG
jgi:hypothetical protein